MQLYKNILMKNCVLQFMKTFSTEPVFPVNPTNDCMYKVHIMRGRIDALVVTCSNALIAQ